MIPYRHLLSSVPSPENPLRPRKAPMSQLQPFWTRMQISRCSNDRIAQDLPTVQPLGGSRHGLGLVSGVIHDLQVRVNRLALLTPRVLSQSDGLEDLSPPPTIANAKELGPNMRQPKDTNTPETYASNLGDLLIIDSEPRHSVGSYWRQLAAQVRLILDR